MGFAISHGALCVEITKRDCGYSFSHPELSFCTSVTMKDSIPLLVSLSFRRFVASQRDGLEPELIALLEAEAPLSLTLYGRENLEDVAVFFRAESNHKASLWVETFQAAVRASDKMAFDLKSSAAEEVTPHLVASATAHVPTGAHAHFYKERQKLG